jgi:hypothetical protein
MYKKYIYEEKYFNEMCGMVKIWRRIELEKHNLIKNCHIISYLMKKDNTEKALNCNLKQHKYFYLHFDLSVQ